MRDLVIYDTNVFIDLIDMDMLDVLSDMGVQIHTTSIVASEITDVEQRERIRALVNLHIYRYDAIEQYEELASFISRFERMSNLSLADFSVIKLSEELSAPLYTTDNRLKRIAKQHGIEVYGSLRIVIEMCREGCISKAEALAAIDNLYEKNARLTQSVVEDARKEIEFI